MKNVIATKEFSHFVRDWQLSPGIDTDDFVFFSGITGTHPDLSVAADPEQQFRDVFQFARLNLEAAGLSFDDVVEMTTYHVGLRTHLDAFIRVKNEFVHEPYPAWTAISITELITEGTLVEIRMIARRSARS